MSNEGVKEVISIATINLPPSGMIIAAWFQNDFETHLGRPVKRFVYQDCEHWFKNGALPHDIYLLGRGAEACWEEIAHRSPGTKILVIGMKNDLVAGEEKRKFMETLKEAGK